MKIKFPFKNHFSRYLFVYLAAFIATPLVCSYSIQIKNRPKDYERFTFFSDVTLKESGVFKDQLFKVLPEDLEIELYDIDASDNIFNTYLSAYGYNSDICLLSETTISKFTSIPFLDLKDTTWNKDDNYVFQSYSIGVLCHNKDGEELKNVFNFKDDNYYLFVVNTSVHLKGLKSGGLTDQVNRVLEYLTSNE